MNKKMGTFLEKYAEGDPRPSIKTNRKMYTVVGHIEKYTFISGHTFNNLLNKTRFYRGFYF